MVVPALFEVRQNLDRESSRDFGLFVAPGAVCGAFIGSTDLVRAVGLGLNSGGTGGSVVGLALVVVLGVAVMLWDLAVRGKYRKRKSLIQKLDPLGAEFLGEDERNFRLSCDEVTQVKFFRKPSVGSAQSALPAKLHFYLGDGRTWEFAVFDARQAIDLRDELKAAGFRIENVG